MECINRFFGFMNNGYITPLVMSHFAKHRLQRLHLLTIAEEVHGRHSTEWHRMAHHYVTMLHGKILKDYGILLQV